MSIKRVRIGSSNLFIGVRTLLIEAGAHPKPFFAKINHLCMSAVIRRLGERAFGLTTLGLIPRRSLEGGPPSFSQAIRLACCLGSCLV